eukprot:3201770-Pleurochrysis_carterae.AAC.2
MQLAVGAKSRQGHSPNADEDQATQLLTICTLAGIYSATQMHRPKPSAVGRPLSRQQWAHFSFQYQPSFHMHALIIALTERR